MKKRWIMKLTASVLAGLMIVTIPGSGLLGGLQEVRAVNETSISNAGFENDVWTSGNGWTPTASSWAGDPSISVKTYASDSYMNAPSGGEDSFLNVWSGSASDTVFTFTQDIALTEGDYTFSVQGMGENTSYYIAIGDTNGTSVSSGGYNAWNPATVDYTAEGDINSITLSIVVTATAAGSYADLDCVTWTYTEPDDSNDPSDPSDPADEASDGELLNGDFSEADTAWTITGGPYYKTDEWASNNTSQFIQIDTPSSTTQMSIKQKIKNLTAGTYKLSYRVSGEAGKEFPLTAKVLDSNDELIVSSDGKEVSGWDVWIEDSTATFDLENNSTITIVFEGEVPTDFWGGIDDVVLAVVPPVTREFHLDTTVSTYPVVDSEIHADKVELMNDFIMGFDVSSYVAIRKSGATFKDYDGNVLTDQGFFDLLKESGVNYVRIRVWVDPTDGNGHTYGGGACDLNAAKTIGTYATNAGMRVLVDFHYSDFWTDPGKQTAPKAWKDLTLTDKAETLRQYTEDSLQELINAGVDVGMVQVGNETTTGFCGESNWTNMCTLFAAGSQGVQNIEAANNTQIMIAIHFTNPESGNFSSFAQNLESNGVVYDVFATSYYPYWHGTLANLKSELSKISKNYDKYVMVAETSYARTFEDGDGHENTESEKKKSSDTFPYPLGIQGQVTHVRNVVNTIASIDDNKGIGVFYWEPAWIPVQIYDPDAANAAEVLAQNKALWERDGSGWATSAASDYDKNVGTWYGGSAVDNEAVFDFDGTALESLKVYNMIRGGTTGEDYLVDAQDTQITCQLGGDITLPETVTGVYASGNETDVEVTWSKKDISEAVYSGTGVYPIDGVAVFDGEEYDVICTLTLVAQNYLINPSFEDPLDGNWVVSNIARKTSAGGNNNIRTGNYNLHFWLADGGDVEFYQTLTLDQGTYRIGGYGVGTEANEFTLYFRIGETEYTKTVNYAEWNTWRDDDEAYLAIKPEITDIEIPEDGTEVTIGVRSSVEAQSWGAFEDFYIYKAEEDVVYHIIEGENSTWSSDEEGNIVIISDGPFVKFQAVKVDGKVVDPADYTAKKGSTVITFLKSYLDTLAEGTHEVEIVFTNGSAKASIAVTQKEETTTAETTTATTATTATTEAVTASVKPAAASTSDAATPKAASNDNGDKIATGDAYKVGLLIILLLLSASGLVITDLWKKKR